MLRLDDRLLVGKGGERGCYLHPEDPSKVVKVVLAQGEHNRQNELEYTYFRHLERKKADYSHIARCYGYADTTMGPGLVFDRVLNHDGSPSRSLRYMMANRVIDETLQGMLLDELKAYLETQKILFVDTSLTNIFCREYAPGLYTLVIIDGLGAKRVGVKSWLYRHCPLYTRYKIKRQWAKFMKMYRADLRRIHEGKRPITRF